jgi:hypothetical protein
MAPIMSPVRRTAPKLLLLALVALACTRAAPADVPLSPIVVPSPSPSPAPFFVRVPDVVGMAYADAKDSLRSTGLKVKRTNQYTSSEQPGQVLKQSRKAGATLEPDTVVTLTVAIAFPPPVFGNPWGYNFACCDTILDPPADFCSFFPCVLTFHNGESFVVECQDGLYSATGGSKQTCSGHDGHKRTLLKP